MAYQGRKGDYSLPYLRECLKLHKAVLEVLDGHRIVSVVGYTDVYPGVVGIEYVGPVAGAGHHAPHRLADSLVGGFRIISGTHAVGQPGDVFVRWTGIRLPACTACTALGRLSPSG